MARDPLERCAWEPARGEPVVIGIDGQDLAETIRLCWRHTNDATPEKVRDNLTRFTVSTDTYRMTWVRWDFERSCWVQALGQKDGAPVIWTPTGPNMEDPKAFLRADRLPAPPELPDWPVEPAPAPAPAPEEPAEPPVARTRARGKLADPIPDSELDALELDLMGGS